jgi:hypothetical protein
MIGSIFEPRRRTPALACRAWETYEEYPFLFTGSSRSLVLYNEILIYCYSQTIDGGKRRNYEFQLW